MKHAKAHAYMKWLLLEMPAQAEGNSVAQGVGTHFYRKRRGTNRFVEHSKPFATFR